MVQADCASPPNAIPQSFNLGPIFFSLFNLAFPIKSISLDKAQYFSNPHSSGEFSEVMSLPKDSNPASILSIKFGAPGRKLYFLPNEQIVSHNFSPSLELLR